MQEQNLRNFVREWVGFLNKYFSVPVVTNMAVTQNRDVMQRHISVVCCIRECAVLGIGSV
jgi:hypothetical protein